MAQVLKPWHQVATPREDLRKGIPLDASAFAIHLDQVIDGRAPEDYREPERFFARTYLTETFRKIAVEVLRRLSGELVGTSPGVNLTTQFGGGKTHFLALLYHLCRGGEKAKDWPGVSELLQETGLSSVPKARVAAFIGNRFDFVVGMGAEGEPKRKTPWGDLAWQLGGQTLFELVKEHDAKGIVPGGGILQQVFAGQPTLILMDEVLSFIRRAREAGEPYNRLSSQFYSFLDVLTREVAGATHTVLVVSLPSSEYEMTQEDEAAFQRLSKLLDRLSKAVLLSEKIEIAEIVRRRLFENVGDPKEIRRTAEAYAQWVHQHRNQLPEWFPADQAVEFFEATYPFHPVVLSVFERKWQSLPKFQRTRGVLRLLALWVSEVWQRAYKEAAKEPLITLGSAPLGNSLFRAAVFEQLGEQRLEAAILSDIAGAEAHAVRLDEEASASVRKLHLHQKVATTVFFESSGGQVRNEATLPEVRLAVGGPEIEIGMIESILDDLVGRCYYLGARGRAYWLSHRPVLNKILADRRAMLSGLEAEERIREKVREVIKEVFKAGLERTYFPEASGDIQDAAILRLVVLAPEHSWDNAERASTRRLIETMVQECGGRGRTYKSGLLFVVAEGVSALVEEARALLALESLEDPAEQERLRLEPEQLRELREKKLRSEQTLRERVWQSYRRVVLLEKDMSLREEDLGLLTSSAGGSLVDTIMARLKQVGLLEEGISPDFLVRNWPPARRGGWDTKSVRDMFFASPEFPRLLSPDTLRVTIARGVREGKFGYAPFSREGMYASIKIDDPNFQDAEVEFSDQVILLPREEALKRFIPPPPPPVDQATAPEVREPRVKEHVAKRLVWRGVLESRQWTNFYTKILTHFTPDPSLRITVEFEVSPSSGISSVKISEIQATLREMGLDETGLQTEEGEDR